MKILSLSALSSHWCKAIDHWIVFRYFAPLGNTKFTGPRFEGGGEIMPILLIRKVKTYRTLPDSNII